MKKKIVLIRYNIYIERIPIRYYMSAIRMAIVYYNNDTNNAK